MEQYSTGKKNLVVKLSIDYPYLSSGELVYKITAKQQIFISVSSIYKISKLRGLITAQALIFLSVLDEFTTKTEFVRQMW